MKPRPAHPGDLVEDGTGAFLSEHDLFGKPVPTLPDHALASFNYFANLCREIIGRKRAAVRARRDLILAEITLERRRGQRGEAPIVPKCDSRTV
jgi:hypothetical protein